MTLLKYKKFSLENRLLVTVSLIFFVTYFSALVITQSIYNHYLNQQYKNRMLGIASNIAFLSRHNLVKQDEVELDKIGRLLFQEQDIHFCYIYDKNGNSSFIQSKKEIAKFDILNNYLGGEEWIRLFEPEFRNYPFGQMIIYPIRIQENSQQSGYVVLGFDEQYKNLITKKAQYTALSVSIAFFLLALFLIHKFSNRVTRPIKNLMSGTDQVINENFDFQMVIEDEGDLGQLARKFNEMTLKLKYFNRQKNLLNKKLNEYNESLEEKVKERTEQLKKIQKEVLAILHQIPVGLLVLDKKMRLMWYNHELLNIAEMEHDVQISQCKLSEIEKFSQIGLNEILLNLGKKSEKQLIQHHLQFSDSRLPKLVEIESQKLMSNEKNIEGTIYIIKDVTREVTLERKMIQDQRLENIGKIAGGIAHDFNNILAIILPNAQLLKLQLMDKPDWVKYLDTIEKAADQAASLTRKILSFSRPSSYESLEVLNLNDIVREFTKMFRRVLDRKIDISEKLHRSLWNIKAEKSQIEQVLMNLSVNSRDAMPDGGVLTFETQNVTIEPSKAAVIDAKLKAGKYVCLNVVDSGSGIPQKYLDKIFDPFFSSKNEGQGTGLGLSVVYGILKTHNGIIDVKSNENVGTHFHIYFPISEEKIEKNIVKTENLVSGTGTLLIVDDEEMIKETLKGMLESLNYKVIFAKDGKNALKMYKSHLDEIDAILMDIQMPVMDGVEAAEKILKINPKARIVFMSGYAEAKSFDKLRKMGHQLFLKKPYKITNLADIIQKALSIEHTHN
jgi:signal transduction histidine kinase/ActR/RegA family two-component response regulator